MTLETRLAAVDARIDDAARAAGRSRAEITRIVVTKFQPASLIRDLAAIGVHDIGENRQQELTSKRDECADDGVVWHFIGQAQTKKARAIRRSADVVHSLDRERLVDALDAAAEGDERLSVLMQVNLTSDENRGGVVPDGLERLAERIAAAHTLGLRGVMAVAPLGEEPARAFARLAEYSQRVRRVVPEATWISAGMTADFAEAIAHGATHLRIGAAITGRRPDKA